MRVIIVVVSALVLTSLARAKAPSRAGSHDDLVQITQGVDTYLVPGGQVNVSIGLYIGYLMPDPKDETITLRMYLRQKWQDDQLAHGSDHSLKFNGEIEKRMWTPDTFFRNALNVDRFSDNPDLSIVILSAEGSVWFVTSQVVTTPCNGLNRAFKTPGTNRVTCPVMVESFKYTSDEVVLQFLDSPLSVDGEAPVPGDVRLVDTMYEDCTTTYTAGTFPCLKYQFVLETHVD